MDVVDEIASVSTDGYDRPMFSMKMKSVKVIDEGEIEKPDVIK